MKTEPLTTFVQTNTNSFREVVQRLTSPSDCITQVEVAKGAGAKKTASSKLHERRQYTRPKLEIVKPSFYCKSTASSPKHHYSFSPSKSISSSFPSSPISGNSNQMPSPKTPSTIFSRLTILEEEEEEKKQDELAMPELNLEEEEKAIKERRFYLHPSPRSKPGYIEPELLTLFPIPSPNTSGGL